MSESKEAVANKVFIGNLSWDVDDDKLRAEFAGCGGIVSAEVVRNRDGTKSRGYGYVVFTDAAGAENAIKKNGASFLDREMRVELQRPREEGEDRPRRRRAKADGEEGAKPKGKKGGRGGGKEAEGEPSNRLFVGNLPFSAEDDSLVGIFSGCDGYVSAEVAKRPNGSSKGWGYVTFGSPAQVAAAADAMAGRSVEDRELRLEAERARAPRAAGGAGGGAGGEGSSRRRRAPRSRDDDATATFTGEPNKVFVGNLAWATDDAGLAAAFAGCTSAEVIKTRDGARSRGYGYVTFADEAGADAAVASMNGQMLDDRELRVEKERRRVREE